MLKDDKKEQITSGKNNQIPPQKNSRHRGKKVSLGFNFCGLSTLMLFKKPELIFR